MSDLFQIERFASEIPEPDLILFLPYPPTVNLYWRHVVIGKRAQVYISAKGKRFRRDVFTAVGHLDEPLRGRLSVEILATMPDRRTRDLDNIPKAVLDALTHACVYADDNQIDRLVVSRAGVQKPGGLEVRIAKIGGSEQ